MSAKPKYKDAKDPLANWGALCRDIMSLPLPRVRALLKRELGRDPAPRQVVVLRLTGRINALSRGDGTRGPRVYHQALKAQLGLKTRPTWRAPEKVTVSDALRAKDKELRGVGAASRSVAKRTRKGVRKAP